MARIHIFFFVAIVMACIAGGSLLLVHDPAYALVVVIGIYLALITFLFPKIGLAVLIPMMLFSPQVAVAGETGCLP